MLQQFTWQHFLVAAAVLCLIWFAVTLLLLRQKSNSSGKQRDHYGAADSPVAHKWDNDVDVLSPGDEREDGGLMGKSQQPEAITTVSSEVFGFIPDRRDTQDQLGLVPDIIEEIKNVFQILSKEDGSKKDFITLIGEIKIEYPRIGSHPQLGQINDFIIDHAPFHISRQELESLWI